MQNITARLVKYKRVWQVIAIIIGCLLAIRLFKYGLLVPPSSDDFSNLIDTRAMGGAWARAIHLYMTWTGRIVTSWLINIFSQSYESFSWVSACLGLCYAASMCLLLTYFLKPKKIDLSWLLSFSILIIVSMTGFYWLIPQGVFWATGGVVYTIPLLFLALFLLSSKTEDKGRWKFFLLCLLAFCTGNGIEQGALIGFGFIALDLKKSDLKQRRFWLVHATYMFGFLVLALAPGNFARGKGAPSNFNPYDLDSWLNNYTSVFSAGWPFLNTALIYGAWCGLLLSFISTTLTPAKIARTAAACFILGLLSLTPFILLPNFADIRVFFYPGILFFFSTCLSVLAALHLFRIGSAPVLIKVCLAWISVGVSLKYYQEPFLERYEIAKQQSLEVEQRRQLILSEKAQGHLDLEVPPLPFRAGFHHAELTEDPNHWINQGYKNFYELNSIRLQSPPK